MLSLARSWRRGVLTSVPHFTGLLYVSLPEALTALSALVRQTSALNEDGRINDQAIRFELLLLQRVPHREWRE